MSSSFDSLLSIPWGSTSCAVGLLSPKFSRQAAHELNTLGSLRIDFTQFHFTYNPSYETSLSFAPTYSQHCAIVGLFHVDAQREDRTSLGERTRLWHEAQESKKCVKMSMRFNENAIDML